VAQLETGRLRIASSELFKALIVKLNSFEVEFTSARNMRVGLCSKDHHGNLVIAMTLALWSVIGRPLAGSRAGS
jgi:hypothetical protein